jgi:acyl carrier protein
MEKKIVDRLYKVFKSVFEINNDSLNMNTNQNSVKKWDSLNHILLIVELESEFGIKFNSGELAELGSMSSLYNKIKERLETKFIS